MKEEIEILKIYNKNLERKMNTLEENITILQDIIKLLIKEMNNNA